MTSNATSRCLPVLIKVVVLGDFGITYGGVHGSLISPTRKVCQIAGVRLLGTVTLTSVPSATIVGLPGRVLETEGKGTPARKYILQIFQSART